MSTVSPSFGEQSNHTICYRIYDVISSTQAPLTLVQVNNEQDVAGVCSRSQMDGAGTGEQQDAEQNNSVPRDRS